MSAAPDYAVGDIDAILHALAVRLADRFTGVFNTETVERHVFESYLELNATARIRRHLPSLTEHFAVDRLTALAQATGVLAKEVPEVLFLCAYNAGRSQIAAALADRYADGAVHVRSAGSHPADEIDPHVEAVLAEVGIDLDFAHPKPLTDDVLHAADVIVTMGCGDACPVLPGKRYLDWPIQDPTGTDLATVRAIRDDIDARVKTLITDITSNNGEPR